MVASLPVGGAPAGHVPNSQPPEPTVVAGASLEPVPDSFSEGAERTTCTSFHRHELLKYSYEHTLKPALIKAVF